MSLDTSTPATAGPADPTGPSAGERSLTPDGHILLVGADERTVRKQRLAASFRLFARFGFDQGIAGHISARDPELSDHFWVNPLGRSFAQMRASDLVLVNAAGEVVDGDRPINRPAFAIHSAIHEARPDVVAAAHAHSLHGVAWSTKGRLLDPISQDACAFYDDHALYDRYLGIVDSETEGRDIAACLGACKAVILRNHGLLTVGDSVETAVWWFVYMEKCCQVQLLADSDARCPTVLIDGVTARAAAANAGSAWFARRCFEPLWDEVVAAQSELLE